MSVVKLAAPVFTFAALRNQAIGQIKLFQQTWLLREEYIDENHFWRGCKLSDLWSDSSRMLIYYQPVEGERNLVSAVVSGQELKVGDRLIVAVQPRIRQKRKSLIKKGMKILGNLKQLQQQGRSVVAGGIVLLAIILIATFTYMSTELKISIIDAFCRLFDIDGKLAFCFFLFFLKSFETQA